jgi:hypothetical protein
VGVTVVQAATRCQDDPVSSSTDGADPDDPLGFDGFDCIAEIGRGGFGVVYRARQFELDRWVALKVVTGAVDDEALLRFERERSVLGARSGHPAIVTVHGSGRTRSGAPFLVMELLGGGSLADAVRRDGPLPVAVAVDLLVQLCGAVASTHAAGVLHRDIKPENVLLDDRGRAKLVDFGMATPIGEATPSTSGVTATVGHAAPEVLVGDPPTTRSDVYSLGSTLFSLLAGHAAFVRPTDESILPVLARIGLDPVPDLRALGAPAHVAAVVERAMAKDPRDRHASAVELGEALRATQRAAGRTPTDLVADDGVDVAGALAGPPAPSERGLPASWHVALGPPTPPHVGPTTATQYVVLAEAADDDLGPVVPLPVPGRCVPARRRRLRRGDGQRVATAVGVAASVLVLAAASAGALRGASDTARPATRPVAAIDIAAVDIAAVDIADVDAAPDPGAAARIVTDAPHAHPSSAPSDQRP